MSAFLVDAESEPLHLFNPEARVNNTAGDWYGEHVGKWLVAASARARWSGDPEWVERVNTVAEGLVSFQEPSGYLGTYAADGPRFTDPKTAGKRTWDVWTHACSILGLIDAAKLTGRTEFTDAASAAADLLIKTFDEDPARLLQYGNHHGLSALIVVEPLALLSEATNEPRFAEFAARLFAVADEVLGMSHQSPPLIGTGKIYQILWVLIGLVALERQVHDPHLLVTASRLWHEIHEHHLTPTGGPWGGVGGHKEVFNSRGFFDPNGMVETCSTMTWMKLSRLLYGITRESVYLDAYHQSLNNALLGACDPNGRDWIYFTFPNGRRNNTYHWACCKSSGAMALEDAAEFAVEVDGSEVVVHPFASMTAGVEGDEVEVSVAPDWSRLSVKRVAGCRPIRVRVPSQLGGRDLVLPVGKGHAEAELHAPIRVTPLTVVIDHHGQEIVREDYAFVSRGPYVYATGLLDGFRKHESLRIPQLNPTAHVRARGEEDLELVLPGRPPILLEPYYRAGGAHDGSWHTTWLEVAWQ